MSTQIPTSQRLAGAARAAPATRGLTPIPGEPSQAVPYTRILVQHRINRTKTNIKITQFYVPLTKSQISVGSTRWQQRDKIQYHQYVPLCKQSAAYRIGPATMLACLPKVGDDVARHHLARRGQFQWQPRVRRPDRPTVFPPKRPRVTFDFLKIESPRFVTVSGYRSDLVKHSVCKWLNIDSVDTSALSCDLDTIDCIRQCPVSTSAEDFARTPW